MGKSVRVLIADDSIFIRARLRLLFAEFDFIELVAEAEDGKEALALFRNHRPDVLVLDIRMPHRNGIEVLEEVRREDQSTVIIMLTSDPSRQHRDRCFELGANYFLDKGKDCERLPDILLNHSKSISRGDPPIM